MKKQSSFIFLKGLVLSVIMAYAVSEVSFAQTTAPISLNGQSFKIDLVDSQNNVSHDVLSFKETSFTCNAILNSPYTATRYVVTKQTDGSLTLYAQAVSENDGSITWKGIITGSTIEGGMRMEKPGQNFDKVMFTGTSRINTNPAD